MINLPKTQVDLDVFFTYIKALTTELIANVY